MPLGSSGLGGIAATNEYVIFGGRDLNDANDVFQCLDANLGLPLWTLEYPAAGQLDYGNSPRSTPLIDDGHVYLFGAFGDLHCVSIDSGEVVWKLNVRRQFGADTELPWGYCASPLIVQDRLIINPGAKNASLVALDPKTGNVIWKTPGGAPGYGSFIAATLGGVEQIVGHDATSLGGWHAITGKRLWTVKPSEDGDFNVPTPLVWKNRLVICTENNGTRIFQFKENGMIISTPMATNLRMAPDMSSAVIVDNRIFCVKSIFYCLDLKDKLKIVWRKRDRAFGDYGSIVTAGQRMLIIGKGELLLVDPTSQDFKIISRLSVFEDPTPIYSHPALLGTRLFIRGETLLKCVELGDAEALAN